MLNRFLYFVFFAAWAALAAAEEPARSLEELWSEAQAAAAAGESEKATEALDALIAKDPARAEAYYLRGRERFRLGKFAESCADFDEYVRLAPSAASRQWERGISLYYAGRYADGAKQFELYQTYHDQDVENSVWRYLCVARSEKGPAGIERAKANMLKIDNDPRVPMMQIYDLYRGKLTPEEVLAAAEAKTDHPQREKAQQFYAHLYVGLWREATGEADLAAEHLRQAAAISEPNRYINRYMWDVARVHVERLDGKLRPEPKAAESEVRSNVKIAP